MRRNDASNRTARATNSRYWLAACVAALLVLLVVLLFVRGLTGQLALRLTAFQSGIATATILLAVCGLRALIAGIYGRFNLRWWLPLPIVLLAAVALTRHAADANATTVIWLMATAGELFSIAWWRRPISVPVHSGDGGNVLREIGTRESSVPLPSPEAAAAIATGPSVEPHSAGVPADFLRAPSEDHAEDSSSVPDEFQSTALGALTDESTEFDSAVSGSPLPDEDAGEELVTQAITRSRALDGSETITGVVRVDFEPHEKHGSAHIAFTPPLCRVPDVSLEQSSGPAASISPGAVYAHGARFDLRLREVTDEPTSVRFEIYVQSPSEHPSSAAKPLKNGESDGSS